MSRIGLTTAVLFASATLLGAQSQTLNHHHTSASATRVQRVPAVSSFTASHNHITFDDLAAGSDASAYRSSRGVTLLQLDGSYPLIWVDGGTRASAQAGSPNDQALRIRQDTENVWPEPMPIMGENNAPLFGLPARPALSLSFESPISRLAFDVRSPRVGASLVVTISIEGRSLATHYFGIGPAFSFVGLQSSQLFDEMRIDLVNPETGVLSLDNLRYEPDVTDDDGDGVPNFIDTCPQVPNPAQRDTDGDGIGNVCDAFPRDPNNDQDGDLIPARFDNCPKAFNPDQTDSDGDGIGDACDPLPLAIDTDGDGIEDPLDNCVTTYNPKQIDCDEDGVGDVCDSSLLEPATFALTIPRGGSTEVFSQICLPPVPPLIDLVLAVDTTASMGEEIFNVRNGLQDAVRKLTNLIPSNFKMAVVDFKDYPNFHTSCGYTNIQYGKSSDYPYRVASDIGKEENYIINRINALNAFGGKDRPEAFTRLLWELNQPDNGLGLRNGSARYVVMIGDDMPHDCDIDSGLATPVAYLGTGTNGVDLGRDATALTGDDLDFHDDALAAMVAANFKLITYYSGTVPAEFAAWQQWSDQTNGTTFQIASNGVIPKDKSIVRTVLKLVGGGEYNLVNAQLNINPLTVSVTPSSFQGPFSVGSAQGPRAVAVKIDVPANLDPTITSAQVIVTWRADGAIIGTQTIDVTIP